MVSAASAGQVVSGQVYDAWWVHSGGNRICLAMSSASGGGGGWASDTGGSNTARGTGYSQLDRATRPYITNKNAIANCFNGSTNYGSVAANQATFLGTVYASANGQVSWTLGAAASGGTAGLLGVWNMYNRVTVATTTTDNGTPYNYGSATIRQARASAANEIQFVLGLTEDAVNLSGSCGLRTAAASGAFLQCGFGFDTTSAYSSGPAALESNSGSVQESGSGIAANWTGILGFHTASKNESSDGSNSNQFGNVVTGSVGTDFISALLRM
jgi:hypothetical protein